jgi:hypothetical protein
MIRGLLAALVIVATSAQAGAYDFLYTDQTPATQPKGSYRLAIELVYLMANESYSEDGKTIELEGDWSATWAPFDVRYGLTDRVALGLKARFGKLRLESVPSGEPSDNGTTDYAGAGFCDLWMWGKYMIVSDPLVTVRAAVKLPAGDGPADPAHAVVDSLFYLDENGDLALGDGQTDLDLSVLMGFRNESGVIELAIGYRYRTKGTFEKSDYTYDFTPGNEVHFAAGYTYELNSALRLRLGTDGFVGTDDRAETDYSGANHEPGQIDVLLRDSARSAVWINPSFEYTTRMGILLGFGMHYPIMGRNIPAEWGVDFRVGFTH